DRQVPAAQPLPLWRPVPAVVLRGRVSAGTRCLAGRREPRLGLERPVDGVRRPDALARAPSEHPEPAVRRHRHLPAGFAVGLALGHPVRATVVASVRRAAHASGTISGWTPAAEQTREAARRAVATTAARTP